MLSPPIDAPDIPDVGLAARHTHRATAFPGTLTLLATVRILFSLRCRPLERLGNSAGAFGRGVLWGAPDTHSRHKRISIECDTTIELDMATLVWTRDSKFPLDQLHGRLKCPKCGERRVKVYIEVRENRGREP